MMVLNRHLQIVYGYSIRNQTTCFKVLHVASVLLNCNYLSFKGRLQYAEERIICCHGVLSTCGISDSHVQHLNCELSSKWGKKSRIKLLITGKSNHLIYVLFCPCSMLKKQHVVSTPD